MLTSPSTVRLALVASVVTAVTALTSCGDEAHPNAPTQAIASGVHARKTGPTAHLLSADKMPTAGAHWAGIDTSADDVEVLGPCHLTSLVDIGALSAVRRTWTAAHSMPRAVQVVARFADNKSAWRAHQVLDTWQGECAERVDGKVGDRRDVDVTRGFAEAYRVAQGDQASDLGILRKGEYVSVVLLVAAADQLPSDSSAAKAAVKRIAATF